MEKVALAIFAKTPGLTPAKTRLAKTQGTHFAETFYLACLHSINDLAHEVAHRSPHELEIAPYWAISESEEEHSLAESPIFDDWPCVFQVSSSQQVGLGQRMSHIYNELLNQYDKVILIGSDTPDLSSKTIFDAIALCQAHSIVFAPTLDGGFSLICGQEKIKEEVWADVNYSVDTTLAELKQSIIAKSSASIKLIDLPYVHDVDFAEDALALKLRLSQQQGDKRFAPLLKVLAELKLTARE